MKPLMPGGRIFICYRREDAHERAHRLRDSLRARFGGAVFIDLDVPPGADVRSYITDTLSSCVVLLAVIGPDWLTISDEHGVRRLESDLDYVRLEIASALNNSNTTVVPLLVNNAGMPVKDELPAEIEGLAGLNKHELSDGVHWDDDVARLLAAIERIRAQSERGGLSAGLSVFWNEITQHRGALAVAAIALAAVIIAIVLTVPGDQPLRIYSSLPEREQLQPRRAGDSREGLGVVRDRLTWDMEDAMRLALSQAGGKAGDFDVTYEPLDDSDAIGESPAALVQANARKAADDDNTAVYIGDLNSGATQQSIPILSRARIPQISMSSTRVGLTTADPQGDVDEPDRYYPPQPGYPDGYRNLVRIVPRDDVQASALLELMTKPNGCRKVAMINDNSPYGEALANNILAQNQHRVKIVFSQSVGPYAHYGRLLDRVRELKRKPDCMVYCGTRNPNTVAIFEAFAEVLPRAKLYGTDGLVAASFLTPGREASRKRSPIESGSWSRHTTSSRPRGSSMPLAMPTTGNPIRTPCTPTKRCSLR